MKIREELLCSYIVIVRINFYVYNSITFCILEILSKQKKYELFLQQQPDKFPVQSELLTLMKVVMPCPYVNPARLASIARRRPLHQHRNAIRVITARQISLTVYLIYWSVHMVSIRYHVQPKRIRTSREHLIRRVVKHVLLASIVLKEHLNRTRVQWGITVPQTRRLLLHAQSGRMAQARNWITGRIAQIVIRGSK